LALSSLRCAAAAAAAASGDAVDVFSANSLPAGSLGDAAAAAAPVAASGRLPITGSLVDVDRPSEPRFSLSLPGIALGGVATAGGGAATTSAAAGLIGSLDPPDSPLMPSEPMFSLSIGFISAMPPALGGVPLTVATGDAVAAAGGVGDALDAAATIALAAAAVVASLVRGTE
jgi:hypothetical protein